MRNIINQRTVSMEQGGIRKYSLQASRWEDSISLCIGEPDFDTPKEIIEEGIRAMQSGKTHYTMNAGLLELRYEIANYVKKYGIDADYETEIMVTCGAMGALIQTSLAMFEIGDEVIVPDPAWLNHPEQIAISGAVPVKCAVKEENGFALNAEDLEKCITPKTKAILVNSPSNPTGAITPFSELVKIAELAKKYDLFIISDEIYCELNYTGEIVPSIASIEGMKERTIVINGFSKSFAMTGWRLGFVIAPKELISKLLVYQENVNSCAPSISQYAGIVALKNMPGVKEMVETYKKRRDLVVDGLNSIAGISCVRPEGAFYAFPNIKGLGKSSAQVVQDIIDNTHVLAVPGSCFGDMGEGYMRISYASSYEDLQEAIYRIKKYVEG